MAIAVSCYSLPNINCTNNLIVMRKVLSLAANAEVNLAGNTNDTRIKPAVGNLPRILLTSLLLILVSVSSGYAATIAGGTYTVASSSTNNVNLTGGGTITVNSIASAVTALNINGVAAGATVQFDFADGYTENTTATAISIGSATLYTSAYTAVIFKHNGVGTNPKLTNPATGFGTGAADAMITINGADNITFDGIDLADVNGAATLGNKNMEYGYYLINQATSNGATGNTIQNCTVTLQRSNTNQSFCVYQNVAVATPTTTGVNSNNTFNNITATNSFGGFYLLGDATNNDLGCVIKNCTVGVSGTADDIGSSVVNQIISGIKVDNQKNLTLNGNTIQNVTYGGGSNFKCYGVYLIKLAGTNNIYNNIIKTITNKRVSSNTASGTVGLYVQALASSTVNIYNNFISNLFELNTSQSSSAFLMMGLFVDGAATSSTVNIYHNSIYLPSTSTLVTPSAALYAFNTAAYSLNVKDNILKNATAVGGGSPKQYCFYTLLTGVASSDYNIYDCTATGNYMTGNVNVSGTQTDKITLAAWKGALGTNSDNNSKQFTTTNFTSTTDLHLNLSSVNHNYDGTPISSPSIATDIDNETRNAAIPYIGGDENLTYPLGITTTTYYYKGTGALNVNTNWGPNTDGSGNGGTSPANFSGNNQIFEIRNTTSITNSVAWSVSGTNSKIVFGNASVAAISLTDDGGISGPIDISAASSGGNAIALNTATVPTFGTLNSTSTVTYSGSNAQTIAAATYGGLTLNNSAGATLASTATVSILTLTSGTLTGGSSLTIAAAGTIVRSAGNLAAAPTFGLTASVAYTNGSPINAGGEIPTSTSVLSALSTAGGSATVSLAANATINGSLTISGGNLTVTSGQTLTVASTTTSFTVSSSKTLTVDGTLVNQMSSGNTFTVSSSGGITVGATGTYVHNGTGTIATPLANFSFDAVSNFIYRGTSTINTNVSISGKTYPCNLAFESSSGAWAPTLTGSSQLTVNGNLRIGATSGTGTFTTGTAFTGAVVVGGSVNITSLGTLAVTTNAISVAGNWTNAGTFTKGTSTVTFNGSSNQNITTAETFNGLEVSNAAGVTLSGSSTTVNVTTLTLSNGNLTLGSNNILLTNAIGGASLGTSKHIVTDGAGAVKSTYASGPYVYAIGADATHYTPVTVINTGGVSQTYTVSTKAVSGYSPSADALNYEWNVVSSGTSASSLAFSWFTSDAGVNLQASPGSGATYQSTTGTSGWSLVNGSSTNTTGSPNITTVSGVTTLNTTSYWTVAIGATVSAPPTLTAASGATVDNNFNITFTEDQTWRDNITAVLVGANTLPASAYDKTVAGQLILKPSQSAYLQTAGTYSITVQSTGYSDAVVNQVIAGGVATKLGITTQPTAPSTNGGLLATQPVVAVQDQYGNTITSSGASISISINGTNTYLSPTTSVNASSGLATFSGRKAGTTDGSTVTASLTFTSSGLTSATSNNFTIDPYATVAADFFQSKTTGPSNWSLAATWQSSPDGSNWYDVTNALVPDNASAGINIQNGHTVILEVSKTIDQMTINGTVIIANTFTLTVANGSGTDLTVSSNGLLQIANGGTLIGVASTTPAISINGTLEDQKVFSSTTAYTFSYTNGTITILSGGTFKISGLNSANNENLPTTLTGVSFTQPTGTPPAPLTGGATLHIASGSPRLGADGSIFNCNIMYEGVATGTGFNLLRGAHTVNGNFIFKSGWAFAGNGGTPSRTLTINGNLKVEGGEMDARGHLSSGDGASANHQIIVNGTDVNGNSIIITGGSLYTVSNTATSTSTGEITLKGGLSHTAGNFGNANNSLAGKITFNSTANSTVQTVSTTGLTATGTNNVAINAQGTGSSVALASNLSINGTLTLSAGSFAVGANTLALTGPTIAGTPTNFSTTSASSLSFGGSSAGVNIPSSVTALNGLTVSNANGVTSNSSIAIGGTMTVNGLFIPQPSNVTSGSGILTGSGTVQVKSATGTADFNTQYAISNKTLANLTVEFAGASQQGITTNTFGGLKINNSAGVTAAGNISVDGALTLTSGSLVIGSNTLTLNGTAAGSGTLTGSSTSDIVIGGSGALGTLNFTQAPDGTANAIRNFTFNRTSGTATLGNKMVILNTYTPTAGVLSSNGNLVLRSSVTTTARVAQGSASGNYITGDVAVERYIPAKRAWRLLTTPLTGLSNNSVFYNWQNNGTPTGTTGAEIWKSGGDAIPTAVNSGLAQGPSSSLLSYDHVNDAWLNVANTNTNVLFNGSANNAYCMFVTGPYNNGSGNIATGATATVLSATGTLRMGNTTMSAGNLGAGQYYLIGNPFASPVDPSALTGTNLGNDFNMWDPNLAGDNGVGGYVTFNRTTNQYNTTTASYSNTSLSNIQSGQAFFVQADAAGATDVTFDEADKTAVVNNGQFRGASTGFEQLRVTLKKDFTNTGNYAHVDAAVAVFHDSIGKAGLDYYDVQKFENGGENIALVRSGSNLVFEHRPLVINANDTLFLKIWNTSASNYSFSISAEHMITMGSMTAILKDKYLLTETPLNLSGTTDVNFSVNSNAASSGNRFIIVFRKNATLPVSFTGIKAYQQAGSVNVEWDVANEQAVDSYEIEKGLDGRSFSKAGSTKATGNNNSVVSYAWPDVNPSPGTNYYRIKSKGINGEVKYTPIVSVRLGKAESTIIVYPNPVTGNTFHVQFTNMAKGEYSISLTNGVGQTVFRKVLTHTGGSSSMQITVPAQASKGVYQLKTTVDGTSNLQSILIQ
jgi:hypothetical protein